jgi:hypothetical protein
MFDIPKKMNKDNAYDNGLKCTMMLKCLNAWKDDKVYNAFENSKTIEAFDKQIESILYQYYSIGNKIIDYFEEKEA